MSRRFRRKVMNIVALSLSGLATAIGLFFLGAILWTLVSRGLAGLSGPVFSAMTPPPGSSGSAGWLPSPNHLAAEGSLQVVNAAQRANAAQMKSPVGSAVAALCRCTVSCPRTRL